MFGAKSSYSVWITIWVSGRVVIWGFGVVHVSVGVEGFSHRVSRIEAKEAADVTSLSPT